MKKIKLNRGQFALVDDEDYDFLMQWKWFARLDAGGGFYVVRNICPNGVWSAVWMHRLIMNTPNNMVVDHIDHNGLNNQKSNLRNCTRKQNSANSKPTGASGYRYVTYDNGKVCAKIRGIDGKQIWLGYFETEEEAARAADAVAFKIHGEFANLNFK